MSEHINDPNHLKNTGNDRKQPFDPKKPWGESVERPPRTGSMPFGRHKGKLVCDLAPDYVAWLKTNVDLHGRLLEDMDRTIAYWKRLLAGLDKPSPASAPVPHAEPFNEF